MTSSITEQAEKVANQALQAFEDIKRIVIQTRHMEDRANAEKLNQTINKRLEQLSMLLTEQSTMLNSEYEKIKLINAQDPNLAELKTVQEKFTKILLNVNQLYERLTEKFNPRLRR